MSKSSKHNNPLHRKTETRQYRPICWISAEGRTERDYFNMDIFRGLNVSIKYPANVQPRRSEPTAVLRRIDKEIKQRKFREHDEAWIVVDVDEWKAEEFKELFAWAASGPRRYLAISNPKFELFLLMHFETGNSCTTSKRIDVKLKHWMPDYEKQISRTQFTSEEVQNAVKHATAKRAASEAQLPEPGMTDVHKLVSNLLDKTD